MREEQTVKQQLDNLETELKNTADDIKNEKDVDLTPYLQPLYDLKAATEIKFSRISQLIKAEAQACEEFNAKQYINSFAQAKRLFAKLKDTIKITEFNAFNSKIDSAIESIRKNITAANSLSQNINIKNCLTSHIKTLQSTISEQKNPSNSSASERVLNQLGLISYELSKSKKVKLSSKNNYKLLKDTEAQAKCLLEIFTQTKNILKEVKDNNNDTVNDFKESVAKAIKKNINSSSDQKTAFVSKLYDFVNGFVWAIKNLFTKNNNKKAESSSANVAAEQEPLVTQKATKALNPYRMFANAKKIAEKLEKANTPAATA